MKGGINFELKADNIIIHAPVDTPKHLINIFRYFLMEQTRLHTEETGGQATHSLRSKRFHLVSEQRKTGFGRARNEMRAKK